MPSEHYVGYYHLSFDITDVAGWLTTLKERFTSAKDPDQYQPLKVLLEPTQQQIGDRVYEVAFIMMPIFTIHPGSEQLTVMLFSYD